MRVFLWMSADVLAVPESAHLAHCELHELIVRRQNTGWSLPRADLPDIDQAAFSLVTACVSLAWSVGMIQWILPNSRISFHNCTDQHGVCSGISFGGRSAHPISASIANPAQLPDRFNVGTNLAMLPMTYLVDQPLGISCSSCCRNCRLRVLRQWSWFIFIACSQRPVSLSFSSDPLTFCLTMSAYKLYLCSMFVWRERDANVRPSMMGKRVWLKDSAPIPLPKTTSWRSGQHT